MNSSAPINGDGFADLAVANRGSNNVSILLNNKAGGFKVTGPYATGTGPYALVAGNFTLKGHTDLAVVNFTDSSVSILANDGTGKFGAPVTTALSTRRFSRLHHGWRFQQRWRTRSCRRQL